MVVKTPVINASILGVLTYWLNVHDSSHNNSAQLGTDVKIKRQKDVIYHQTLTVGEEPPLLQNLKLPLPELIGVFFGVVGGVGGGFGWDRIGAEVNNSLSSQKVVSASGDQEKDLRVKVSWVRGRSLWL